jgi:iron complex transport system substrate-binding protein
VTHECDYPPQAERKPRVTASAIDSAGLTSLEIDQAVRDSLAEQATIYHLDRDLLESLRPDLILTQELCAVCAVGVDEVRAVADTLSSRPRVESLEPTTLTGVLDSILTVGRLTGTLREAIALVEQLRGRIQTVQRAVTDRPIVPVLTLEWMDPPFVGGHWVPEMVALAGGKDVLGEVGTPSREVTWEEIVASQPEVVIGMPCGFGLERSRLEVARAPFPAAWQEIPAVEHGRVYVVDGSSYFNRPGPRLIDGVEMLAAILHPEVWSTYPPRSFDSIGTAGVITAS